MVNGTEAVAGTVAVVVVAAGRGLRAGGGLPKQYRRIAGRTVLRRTLEALTTHPAVSIVQPVVHPDDHAMFDEEARGLPVRPPVAGGATRQASVRAGLEALATDAPDVVLVHDAARPFLDHDLVTRVIAAAHCDGGAVPFVPIRDTVKMRGDGGLVAGTVDRDRLAAVQTPQGFRFALLLEAHRKAATIVDTEFTDDAAIAEWAGLPVRLVEGSASNMKLTTPEDFRDAEARLLSGLADVRTGTGFDVHTFGPGDHVMLGGVRIPHSQGVVGHSDADVVLHALTDAVLGAIADGDIGVHFPPSDERWRGASSDRFLRFAIDRVAARGGIVAHLDVGVLAEAPRIGPHRDAMRACIAAIAGLSVDRVGLKATTTEGLGFVGRREGIAAFATATIRLPAGEP